MELNKGTYICGNQRIFVQKVFHLVAVNCIILLIYEIMGMFCMITAVQVINMRVIYSLLHVLPLSHFGCILQLGFTLRTVTLTKVLYGCKWNPECGGYNITHDTMLNLQVHLLFRVISRVDKYLRIAMPFDFIIAVQGHAMCICLHKFLVKEDVPLSMICFLLTMWPECTACSWPLPSPMPHHKCLEWIRELWR